MDPFLLAVPTQPTTSLASQSGAFQGLVERPVSGTNLHTLIINGLPEGTQFVGCWLRENNDTPQAVHINTNEVFVYNGGTMARVTFRLVNATAAINVKAQVMWHK